MTKAMAEIKEYGWRKATQAPREWAPVFGSRVDWLQDRLGHAPTVREVYEDAKDTKSPIHDMFNWDDEEAAEKFRRIQVGTLLSALVIKVEVVEGGKRQSVDMPVRVVLKGGHRRRERISDVMSSAELRAVMLDMATDEMLSIQRRYNQIRELSRVFQEVEIVQKKVLPKVKALAEKSKGTKQITLK